MANKREGIKHIKLLLMMVALDTIKQKEEIVFNSPTSESKSCNRNMSCTCE